MKRKVFYSFHYTGDAWRVQQIRQMGAFDDCDLPLPNAWEEVRYKSENEIKGWIDKHLEGRSCTIVLIGAQTARRKWVEYEIKRSWDRGMGVIGVYIHNLKNQMGYQSARGASPFEDFRYALGYYDLAFVPEYCGEWGWSDSSNVYNYIKDNISTWVEAGIRYRDRFPKTAHSMQV